MKIARGKKIYDAATSGVKAEGRSFTDDELDDAIENRLAALLRDDEGREQIRVCLHSLAKTQFESARLRAALSNTTEPRDWQVGEAIGEAYLTDHRECEFPWPSSRDLRNPSASPAGADLVGFQKNRGSTRFAFGEAKTSSEAKWPPGVVTSRHGLVNQLEVLRDSLAVKEHLGLIYLGFRVQGTKWYGTWKTASLRYLGNPEDIALFGVLVRDVTPQSEDLSARSQRLGRGCPADTYLELVAFYLPLESISTLSKRVSKSKSK